VIYGLGLAAAPQSHRAAVEEIRVAKESSDSGVEIKQAAESVAAANGLVLRR